MWQQKQLPPNCVASRELPLHINGSFCFHRKCLYELALPRFELALTGGVVGGWNGVFKLVQTPVLHTGTRNGRQGTRSCCFSGGSFRIRVQRPNRKSLGTEVASISLLLANKPWKPSAVYASFSVTLSSGKDTLVTHALIATITQVTHL